MTETGTPDHEPIPEKRSHIARVFEHLYPGTEWRSLPLFNVLNTPTVVRTLAKDYDRMEENIVLAEKLRTGYALRVNLTYSDKLFLSFYLLNGCVPLEQLPELSYVSDLVLPDETLGGQVIKDYAWISDQVLNNQASFETALLTGADMFEHHPTRLIGVLNKQKRPSALLVYKEGPRIPYRVERVGVSAKLRPATISI